MKFIGKACSKDNWQNNILTDGKITYAYKDMQAIFNKLQDFFIKKNINNEDCLALECDNSVSNALVLLYLLEENCRFLLLPKIIGEQSLPKFCHYIIKVENINESNLIFDPDKLLHIVENEQWQNDIVGINQKLYLRTSGSTGTPKLAVHSHKNLQGNVLNAAKRLKLSSNDRIAIPVPLFHMYGLSAAFLPAISVGASIDIQKGANMLLNYLEREQDFNPNVAFLTPIFCETLLRVRKSPRKYRLTITAGDRLRGNTFVEYEQLFGCLVQLYGSTEMGAIAAGSPDDASKIRAISVSKAMDDVAVRISNGDSNSGELWCNHKYGFEGYVNNDGLPIHLGTEDSQDGWFRTKDLGKISPEGYIEVLGRSDHSVNRDGLLVFFSDIEKAIENVDGIEAAVVVSKGESQRGKNLVLYCVSNKNKDEITSICFDILPKHTIPDDVIIIKNLPLLQNGKIDRQKLTHRID